MIACYAAIGNGHTLHSFSIEWPHLARVSLFTVVAVAAVGQRVGVPRPLSGPRHELTRLPSTTFVLPVCVAILQQDVSREHKRDTGVM